LKIHLNFLLKKLAINILRKPLQNRGSNDITLLKKCIENIRFFTETIKEKGQEIIENLCNYLVHKYIKEGEIVFREGFF